MSFTNIMALLRSCSTQVRTSTSSCCFVQIVRVPAQLNQVGSNLRSQLFERHHHHVECVSQLLAHHHV